MFCQLETLRRFLVAQEVFDFVPKIQFFTTFLHPLWLYIFVYYFDMSITGVAISTSITHTLSFLIAYIWISLDNTIVREGCWNYINKDSFIDLIGYLKYGIPCYIMLALEIWGFEALSIMSGYIGVHELGASVIIINIMTFFYMIPLGVSFIASSLVGSNLGASKPRTAKVYTNISIVFVFILSIIIGG